MAAKMRILFWRSLVVIFLILAFIGALLPGMPTTVFLILAAWAASKGWPALDLWLTNHPKYGRLIREWRANRTIPRRAKVIASLMMLGSGTLMLFTPAPFWVKVFTDGVMFSVTLWMWTRPEPKAVALPAAVLPTSTAVPLPSKTAARHSDKS